MGLAARQAEAAGIPALCMSSALDITRSVNPPRAAFLDFPLGHTTGKANEPGLQRAIMLEALDAFTSLREPGQVKLLPFRWDEDDSWKRAMERSDARLPRVGTPQYQCDEDRALAEGAREGSCPVCGVEEA
ncbi:MAG: hypothetical protein HS107_14745 [Thermoflexaceae bacterium]|nr:hypothetical protein [Thermoflexaceae bacterium]